jgi:Flp pilus assembly protein TadG
MTERIWKRLKDTTGANMLEAAIITPLLLLLTFAIADFGALLYVELALQNGLSQASRYGVTGQAMPNMDHAASVRAAMRQATPTLTLADNAFTFQHMAIGGNAWIAGTGGPNEIEKVTVDYDWNIITPVIKPFFTGGKIHFTVESAMKNEERFQ